MKILGGIVAFIGIIIVANAMQYNTPRAQRDPIKERIKWYFIGIPIVALGIALFVLGGGTLNF